MPGKKSPTKTTLKRKQGRPKGYKNTDCVKIDTIRKQVAKNPLLSQADLARINNTTRQSINQLLIRHGVDIDTLQSYKESRADIFAGKQEMVLRNIDEAAVKKMLDKAPMAAVNLYGVLYDKERLERGQSTSNEALLIKAIIAADSPDTE